jgi:hypothetical protein
MWSLLKFLMFLALIVVLAWFGANVKIGEHTFFGHVSRIWRTEEAQDLVRGAKESAGPAVDKMKRGVKAGLDEATRENDAGPADAGPREARPGKKSERPPR